MVHLIFHSFLDNWPKVPTITAQRCSERTLCSSLPFVKVMTDGETGQNRANKELWSNLSFRILCNSRKQKQEAWIRNKIIFNVLFLQIYLSLEIFLEKKNIIWHWALSNYSTSKFSQNSEKNNLFSVSVRKQ